MMIGAFYVNQFIDSLSMTFVSGWFLVFVVFVVLFYYAISLKNRWIALLAGSLGFCLLMGGWQIALMPVLVTAVSYCAALIIEGESGRRRKQKTVLSIAVVSLVGALVLVKLNVYYQWDARNFIFPVGISYYTFSAIGYIADVYWKKDNAEQNFFKLLLFISFFPKILEGPIASHKTLGKELITGHRFSYTEFCYGMQLAVWGYFKKSVIADRLSPVVQTVFGNDKSYGGALLFAVLALSAVQGYCDFSGCMDIAVGISQMCGVSLEKNFDHPFFSKSAAEFWRRWHITLGAWFKDYVYMPIVVSPRLIRISGWLRKHVGKQAGKAVMTVIPLVAVWILTGLWHGTGVSYLLWGVYWGSIISVSTVFAKQIKKLTDILHINTESFSWRMVQMVRTFLLFCIGRLISMQEDLKVAGRVFLKFFKDSRVWQLFDGTVYQIGLDRKQFQLAMAAVLVLWIVEILQTKCSIRESISKWNVVCRAFFYSMSFLLVLVIGYWGPEYNAASFMYMNF